MRITADLFFFIWTKEHPPVSSSAGREPVVLRHIRMLESASDHSLYEEDILYILENRVFTGDEDGPSCQMEESFSGTVLLQAVTDCWNEIFAWDHHICEGILGGGPADKIMTAGCRYLSFPYILIDREMQVLYASPGYSRIIDVQDAHYDHAGPNARIEKTAGGKAPATFPETALWTSQAVPAELVQSLLLSKDFHAAELRPSPFYFFENLYGRNNYCRNLFLDGRYYARLIMTFPDDLPKLSDGEEQLFELFAGHVEQLCQREVRQLRQKQSDPLHQILGTLIREEPVSPGIAGYAFRQAGWLPSHTCIAGQLTFFSRPGWHTHLDYTLPYLVSCVEKTWPVSCAFVVEDHVRFVINLTRSIPVPKRPDTVPAADTDQDPAASRRLRIFCQQLAVLVRDNVCRAGISSAFHDIMQLPAASLQARSALDLGRQNDPDRWYYLFDDYRLAFALNCLRKEAASGLIPHPALQILRNFDAEKGTELLATLRAYFAAGLNMSLAADQLFIHRTTFCRRFEKIRALTGIDTENQDRMLELAIALRLEDA